MTAQTDDRPRTAGCGKKKPLPPLALFLQDELSRKNMTKLELSARSGIPDSTISRIMAGEVEEPKGSVVAKLAHGINRPFWYLMEIMGVGDGAIHSPNQEQEQISALLAADPELRSFVDRAMKFSPRNRVAVLAYMELIDRMTSDPPDPPGE